MSHDDRFRHEDALAFLNEAGSLPQRLSAMHESVRKQLPFVARIALALYDPDTSALRTFLHSADDGEPALKNYEALLSEAPSLREILERRRPRVINSMLTFEADAPEHTQRIGRAGYAASYTLPMFNEGTFFGFLFFNSYERDVFTEKSLQILDLFGHLTTLAVIAELSSSRTLRAAVKTTGRLTHLRDPETGSHLDRMSRYSRLIARALADRHNLDDDYIEHVFKFAPLHDLGKVAIPDRILLKPGTLDEDETRVMRTHVLQGVRIIDDLLAEFGLEHMGHVEILRNIALGHHEAVNGTGYPEGRSGEAIPLEARVVAVADVFDALTSVRPYKRAWTVDEAFAALETMAGEKLDRECVDALLAHRDEVEAIMRRYAENPYG